MGSVAIVILVLALGGAVASWVVGAVAAAQGLRRTGDEHGGFAHWMSVAAWPLAMQRVRLASQEHGSTVNKAIVAFFVCMTVAVATVSLSTNYNRITK